MKKSFGSALATVVIVVATGSPLISFFALPASVYASSPTLVGYWKFDESAGDAADSSGNGITLANNGAVAYVAGKFNNAAQFNGSNYFSGTGPDLDNSSFSFSFWIYYATADGQYHDFFGLGSNTTTDQAMHFRVNPDGTLRLGFYADDLDTSGTAPAGQWDNILFTFDASTHQRKAYVNGTLIGSDTSSGDFEGNTDLTIGKSPFFTWNGLVDDFRIYSSVLTPDQVTDISSGDSGNPPVISSVVASATDTGSIVTWSTDEAASTEVVYSTDMSFTSSTTEADTVTKVTSHSAVLSGLVSCTLYNFEVVSEDDFENYATSTASTFTTTGCPSHSDPSPSVSVSSSGGSVSTSDLAKLLAPSPAATAYLESRGYFVPAPAAVGTVPSADIVFTRDLQEGMSGDDVLALQKFLISADSGPAAQALAENGTTNYFGPLTQAALAEYQSAHGISPAVGYFGQITRMQIGQ